MRVAVVLWLAVAGCRGDLLDQVFRTAGQGVEAVGTGLQQQVEGARHGLHPTNRRFQQMEAYQVVTEQARRQQQAGLVHHITTETDKRLVGGLLARHSVTETPKSLKGVHSGHRVEMEAERSPKDTGAGYRVPTEKKLLAGVDAGHRTIMVTDRIPVGTAAGHRVLTESEKRLKQGVEVGHRVVTERENRLKGIAQTGHRVVTQTESSQSAGEEIVQVKSVKATADVTPPTAKETTTDCGGETTSLPGEPPTTDQTTISPPTVTEASSRALPDSDDINLRAVIAVAARPCPQGHAMVSGKCKLIF